MIHDDYELFEEGLSDGEINALSDRCIKVLTRLKWWKDLQDVFMGLIGQYTDETRTDANTWRCAWDELLRRHMKPSQRTSLVRELERQDLTRAGQAAKEGGTEALNAKLAKAKDARSQRAAAKLALWEGAGSAGLRDCVQWAVDWEGKAKRQQSGRSYVEWRDVDGPAPGRSALAYLEMAVERGEKFFSEVVPKFLAKKDPGEDKIRLAEEKSIAEILGMLGEVKQEIEEKGINAYA